MSVFKQVGLISREPAGLSGLHVGKIFPVLINAHINSAPVYRTRYNPRILLNIADLSSHWEDHS